MVAGSLAMVSCGGWAEADFSGADEPKAGEVYVENYPIFTDASGNTISNNSEVYLSLGDVYDLDYTCTVAGADKTSESVLSITDVSGADVSSIDTSVPGLYYLNYTADSEHGLDSWTTKRTVFVYDPSVTTSIGGSWNVDMTNSTRYGSGDWYSYADWAANYGKVSSVAVSFTELCPGFYKASDLIFGWYDLIRGYGAAYPSLDFKMSGYICLNADDSISLLSSSFGYSYWGESLTAFSGSYDSSSDTVHMEVEFDDCGYYADIYLTR